MSQVARRYFERGSAALASGDVASAQASLRAAVDLGPGYANARI